MKNKEKPSEIAVRNLLMAHGFDVERIEGEGRCADYRVSDGRHSYLVEVTIKEPDIRPGNAEVVEMTERGGLPYMAGRPLSSPKEWADILRAKGSITMVRRMDRNPTFADKLSDKVQQLNATPFRADFKTLWIGLPHQDARHIGEMIQRTLYGMAHCFGFERPPDPHGPMPKELIFYYYYECPFFVYPELDAVALVVLAPDESAALAGVLFVNPLGAKAAPFRGSGLHDWFGETAHVVDPSPSGNPHVLFLDPAMDRSEDNAQWEYIKKHHKWWVNGPHVTHCMEALGIAFLNNDAEPG